MSDTLLEIVVILILYGLAAAISGSEAAFFSLKSHDIEWMGPSGTRVARLLSQPRRLLIAILASNLLVNSLSAALVEGVAHKFFGEHALRGIALAIGVAGFLLLVFGEVAPKTYALKHRIGFARLMSPFVSLLVFVWKPLTLALLPITKALTRRFEGGIEEGVTEDDIRSLVSHTNVMGALDESVQRWIHSIFELDKLRAIDLMTKKEKIFALPKDIDFDSALAEIIRTRYSRIPLYAGSMDQIVGVLYAKDMLAARARGQSIKPARIAREPVFVPRWKRCDLLLHDLRALKTHMAIVVDEFGGTSGLITLENLLEAIVGKIRDAHKPVGAIAAQGERAPHSGVPVRGIEP